MAATIGVGLLLALAGCGRPEGPSGWSRQDVLPAAPHDVVVRIDVLTDVVDTAVVDTLEEEPPEGLPGPNELILAPIGDRRFLVYWYPLQCQERPHLVLLGDAMRLHVVVDPGPLVLNRDITPPEECNAVGRFLRLTVTTKEPLGAGAITGELVARPLSTEPTAAETTDRGSTPGTG
jgi:hypothetical protein